MTSRDEYVLDTSVIVEYIDEESPYSEAVEELYTGIVLGGTKVYIMPTTICEVLYTSYRVYRKAGVEDPNLESVNFVRWFLSLAGVQRLEITDEVAILAGEIKKSLRLSVVDCIVIAAARHSGVPALFLKPEREMEPQKEKLMELGVKFLV